MLTNEEAYYLKQYDLGEDTHRKADMRFRTKYNMSTVPIREKLLRLGLIEYVGEAYVKSGVQKNRKVIIYRKASGKQIFKSIQTVDWEDGSKKSINNAFNWRSNPFEIYSNADLAVMSRGGDPRSMEIKDPVGQYI